MRRGQRFRPLLDALDVAAIDGPRLLGGLRLLTQERVPVQGQPAARLVGRGQVLEASLRSDAGREAALLDHHVAAGPHAAADRAHALVEAAEDAHRHVDDDVVAVGRGSDLPKITLLKATE